MNGKTLFQRGDIVTRGPCMVPGAGEIAEGQIKIVKEIFAPWFAECPVCGVEHEHGVRLDGLEYPPDIGTFKAAHLPCALSLKGIPTEAKAERRATNKEPVGSMA